MIAKFFDAFFGGCWHNHYSFPITVSSRSRRNTAASLTGTYVVCLDCSKEFPYDWQEMKVITSPAEADRRMHGATVDHNVPTTDLLDLLVQQRQKLHGDVQPLGLHEGLGRVKTGIVSNRNVLNLETRWKDTQAHIAQADLPTQLRFQC